MKLRFRLPDEDEDETEAGERPAEPPEPSEPVDPRDISRKAMLVAIGGVATQVLWPLPVLHVVLFGSIGVLIGAAAVLKLEKQEAAFAGFILWGLMDFFTPSGTDIGFLVRTFVVTLGALGAVVAARRWILRALGEGEDEGRGSAGPQP